MHRQVRIASCGDARLNWRCEVTEETKKKQEFAAMDPALVRAIASKGGVAAHAAGTAHQWTQEEAKRAGSAGGHAAQRAKRERGEAKGEAK